MRATSKQKFDNCKRSLECSGLQDNCISKLFHNFLVPLENLHKPELVEQARHLITKGYELSLFDPATDDATEAQDGDGFQGKEKDTEDV